MKYEQPKAEVVTMNVEDVITASGGSESIVSGGTGSGNGEYF